MTRFFVTPEEMAMKTPCLTGDNAAHARVLRLKPGEQVPLCDGQAQDCLCRVENLNPEGLELTLLVLRESGTEARDRVW